MAAVLTMMAIAACGRAPAKPTAIPGADIARGRILVQQTGCAACHEIPGVVGPKGRVGPSLAGLADRALIGGRVPNRPDLLSLWVRNAPALSPDTGMPPMPLNEQEARDVAAFLLTLDAR